MAHFFLMQGKMDEVAKKLFAAAQEANDALPTEVAAVTKIQSVHRASQIRSVYHAVVAAAQLIQRIIRGCLGRRRAKSVSIERTNKLQLHFFHHCACTIQRLWRGWWSRLHVHDFYMRRDYLVKVEQRGKWTQDFLSAEHKEKLHAAKMEEEVKVREEFDNLAGDLHHLMSTSSIPGVYNPPYSDLLPKAFEKPIEDHLRDACRVQLPKALRRPRHHKLPSPKGSTSYGASQAEKLGHDLGAPPQELPERAPFFSRTASTGHLRKVQGPFRSREQIEVANIKAANTYRTIQASSPYDAVEADRRMQERISKLARSSPVDFMAPGSVKDRHSPVSVHVGLPYKERPLSLRGDYVELPKIRDKPPFFTALGQGKQFSDYHEQPMLPHGQV
ncbi:SPATA17 [Symbiodinium natans]|uniref:SPATA17 protein n=1 Tax=Symbiodinium natans TaxID=878477 RepID=A0A812PKC0_9DINO|nr:SPATA17 [Symbiodinium natans]